MDLGYGFKSGTNRISKQKVCFWLNTDINWNAFIGYMADHCEIEDFGEDWINIRIASEKQLAFRRIHIIEYDEMMHSANYEADCETTM